MSLQPLDNGNSGYILTVKDTSRLMSKTYKVKTRGVVLSAGVMGTVSLLLKQKYQGKTLPAISELLGSRVRTSSEPLVSVCVNKKYANGEKVEVCNAPSITFIIAADDETNIEIVRYNKSSDLSLT